jgi:hypothetical protein
LKVPTVNAIGPLDIHVSNRGAAVAAGAGLICLLIVGHGLRAMAARRP